MGNRGEESGWGHPSYVGWRVLESEVVLPTPPQRRIVARTCCSDHIVAFELHPRLAADGIHIGNLPLCTLLLNNDARFPWCILVPRLDGLRDLHEVPHAHRDALFDEIEHVCVALQAISRPDKMNVAALGNMVPQLHIHLIARHTTDVAWPAPVWSVPGATPYPDPAPLISALKTRLHLA